MIISQKLNLTNNRLNYFKSNNFTNPFDIEVEELYSPTEGMIRGKKTLLLGTHNYLGLSMSKLNIDAAIEAVTKFGTGTTGSRVANGTFSLHANLEKNLKQFMVRNHAIIFSTGYQANLGTISGITGKDDQLFIDSDSHASIYDGATLSGAEVIRFRHNSPEDLLKRMERAPKPKGLRLIVIESVYSMTGNIAPLDKFIEVKKITNSSILVDEAHSFGIMGKTGRGLAEEINVEAEVDIITGTFSKSIGAVGGFCVSNNQNIEALRYCSRPYMFTASLPPDVIGATLAGLAQIQDRSDLRSALMHNARKLRSGLLLAGLNVGKADSPIVSIDCGDEINGLKMWHSLLDKGVYVNLSLPPATPSHHALLRCSVMAPHTSLQIDTAIKAFVDSAIEIGIL